MHTARQFEGNLRCVGLETRRKLLPRKGKQAWGEVHLNNEKSQFFCWYEAENILTTLVKVFENGNRNRCSLIFAVTEKRKLELHTPKAFQSIRFAMASPLQYRAF